MKYSDLVSYFTKATKENFPKSECSIKEKDKSGWIYNSDKWYLCLTIDKRFNYEFDIRVLKPYIWYNQNKTDYGFAWIDQNGNWVDNMECAVHSDTWDEFVIGFAEQEDKGSDEKTFNEWVNIIEEHNQSEYY